jgi:hypothetical protein
MMNKTKKTVLALVAGAYFFLMSGCGVQVTDNQRISEAERYATLAKNAYKKSNVEDAKLYSQEGINIVKDKFSLEQIDSIANKDPSFDSAYKTLNEIRSRFQ